MLEKTGVIKEIINIFQWLSKKIKTNHKMILLFRNLYFPINKPLPIFASIYAFSLADISKGNPNEIIEIFERQSIRKRIEYAINQVSIDDIEEEVLASIDENIEFNSIDIDFKVILSKFIKIFLLNLEKSQNISETVLTNQVKKIKESIIDFKETKNDLNYFNYYTENKKFKVFYPFVIPSLPDCFIFRNDFEEQLLTAILPNNGTKILQNKTLALIGSYGVGKSTLVISICNNQKIRSYFQKIIVLPFSEIGDLSVENVLHVFFTALGGKAEKELSKSEYIYHIRSLLENQRTLLILDDVENSENIDDVFSCKTDSCTVILTTRNRDLPFGLEIINTIEIKGFSKQEYLSFVRTFFNEKISNEIIAREILPVGKLIDFNPLALKIICTNIN